MKKSFWECELLKNFLVINILSTFVEENVRGMRGLTDF